MGKHNNWLNSVVISGVAVIGFMVGALYGKQFNNLQWETLLAGIFGLVGGFLAYKAATEQQRAILTGNKVSFKYRYYSMINKYSIEMRYIKENGIDKLKYTATKYYKYRKKFKKMLKETHILEKELQNKIMNCAISFENTNEFYKKNVDDMSFINKDENMKTEKMKHIIKDQNKLFDLILKFENDIENLEKYLESN